jgi:hypothetical protein
MFESIKKIIKDTFTEPDNKSVCPVRILGVLSILQGLGMQAYDVLIQHAHFDLQAFGIGMSATLGALGVALGLKKDSPKE